MSSKSWYKNGQKENEVNYKDGKHMSTKVWKPNGEKCPETSFKDGNGVEIAYHSNGQKFYEKNYKDGKLDGLLTRWYSNGQKSSEKNFKDGKYTSVKVWKPNGEKCPVTKIDEDGNGVVAEYFDDGTEFRRETISLGQP